MKELLQDLDHLMREPKRLRMMADLIESPDRSLVALDLIINDPKTSSESKKRFSDIRTALLAFINESKVDGPSPS